MADDSVVPTPEPVEAKAWYQSRVVLSLIAGIIIAVCTTFGILPEWLTQDKLVELALWVVPLVSSLIFRLKSKGVKLFASKAKAVAHNSQI